MKDFLTNFTDSHLVVIAMVLFLFVFSVVSWQALRKSKKSFYEEMSNLPLSQEAPNEQR